MSFSYLILQHVQYKFYKSGYQNEKERKILSITWVFSAYRLSSALDTLSTGFSHVTARLY